MKYNYHTIINQYGSANISIKDISRYSIESGRKSEGVKTVSGLCGFVIPLSGQARYKIDDSEYILNPNMVLHAGGSMSLSKEVLGNSKWEYILLHYECGNEKCRLRDSLIRKHYSVAITPTQHDLISNIAIDMWSLSRKNDQFLTLGMKSLFFQLIETIFLYSDADESVCTIKNYIDKNFHKKLTIESLADKFHMSSKSFSYQFKKEVGMSPKQYIMESRLNLAKQLIRRGGYRINEVSNKVGYDDALYFSRAFKKYVGQSPKQYAAS
ncbi:helix-turn-helix transcriptional regulator [Spirochaeta cellobiosiphila]|uniref:helix-turn-helix transcriptional regulator n=1 Tax=Spirochaeta cellobiosiphila TaxID=504483 RepID=UPI0004180F1E|nr:AraC family transcriptional regulator [Spirochaeta cellobiosiphila]